MNIQKATVFHDFYEGMLEGGCVEKYQKTYGEIKHIYHCADDSITDSTVMYEVYTADWVDSADRLLWGLSVLHPVLVDGECNMTRGHFHEDENSPEIYFGFGGSGLLMLMDRAGNLTYEEICKGSVHYIDGKLAHRLINTGDEPLKVGACWANIAGHDYEAIERSPFGQRVFLRNGKIILEERV